jgi:hypothetical protein
MVRTSRCILTFPEQLFIRFTETKTVYVDYSGQLQKAQMDNVED